MSIDISLNIKLEDFSLQVTFATEKRRIGILGPSGCGKSMTLKSIAGIVKPDSGHVILDDKVLFDSDKKISIKAQKRNVGYLFQNYALFPTMTVEQNIATGINGSRHEKERIVADMIRDFRLEGLEKRLPRQISGGQQQRVALARMMAYKPDVLLFDEPFSAMDAYLREGLRLELLELLKRYDKTAIMVTHDRDEAYQMCDELILMDKGRILDMGDTKEIFARPKTPTIARLTGCKNISRAEVIDKHTVKALEWDNIILKVSEEVNESIKYIGIRAHDLIPYPDKEGINVISPGKAKVSEMPFEWYVTLENGIWWKSEKTLAVHDTKQAVPEYLMIPPESILLMSED